jgi:hypothetical protein
MDIFFKRRRPSRIGSDPLHQEKPAGPKKKRARDALTALQPCPLSSWMICGPFCRSCRIFRRTASINGSLSERAERGSSPISYSFSSRRTAGEELVFRPLRLFSGLTHRENRWCRRASRSLLPLRRQAAATQTIYSEPKCGRLNEQLFFLRPWDHEILFHTHALRCFRRLFLTHGFQNEATGSSPIFQRAFTGFAVPSGLTGCGCR